MTQEETLNSIILKLDSNENNQLQPNRNHQQVKREPSHRIFVNRSIQLSTIKFFGFDMDHTLAVSKTDAFNRLTFRNAIDYLIRIGYPEDLRKCVYDDNFAIRGLWFDKIYGNLCKIDQFGNILGSVHGFKTLTSEEIEHFYPNKFIAYDEARIFVMPSLYELPEAFIIACVIDFFSSSPDYKREDKGVTRDDIFISYMAMYEDVRSSIEYQYTEGLLEKELKNNVEKYIYKNENLHVLLNRIRENNAKAFLLTNAGFDYTDKLMSYLLNDAEPGRDWRSYFDYIVVDARKPLFFQEGSVFKEINVETKAKSIGCHMKPLLYHRIYSGGNCSVFQKLIGSTGKDILYVGDHIYSDIIKSKKDVSWYTFLIVPELTKELKVWHEKRHFFAEIEKLNESMSKLLVNFDSSSKNCCPDVSEIRSKMEALTDKMDSSYSFLGSTFRSGSQQTHFASQVMRYADIYSSTCLNLLHYPFFYFFKAPSMLMPHESTVDHDDPFVESN